MVRLSKFSVGYPLRFGCQISDCDLTFFSASQKCFPKQVEQLTRREVRVRLVRIWQNALKFIGI